MNFASKSSSVYSSHARTVMGNGKKLVEQREDDHGKHCSNCKEVSQLSCCDATSTLLNNKPRIAPLRSTISVRIVSLRAHGL